MQDTRELIGRLNQGARPLSKGHRRIAEYIAQHYDKAVFMTAGALGRECGVSESTVVRFASAMGYEGYPELRERLRGLVSQRLTSEQRFAITSGIEQGDVLATVLKNDAHNIRKTVEALSQEDLRMLCASTVLRMLCASVKPSRRCPRRILTMWSGAFWTHGASM